MTAFGPVHFYIDKNGNNFYGPDQTYSHKMWAVKLSLVDSKEFFDSDMTNYFEQNILKHSMCIYTIPKQDETLKFIKTRLLDG